MTTMISKHTRSATAFLLAVSFTASSLAQEVTLRMVSAFPENGICVQRILVNLPQLQIMSQGAAQLQAFSYADLADDSGQALNVLLAFV